MAEFARHGVRRDWRTIVECPQSRSTIGVPEDLRSNLASLPSYPDRNAVKRFPQINDHA
jgi:hypothetical protein